MFDTIVSRTSLKLRKSEHRIEDRTPRINIELTPWSAIPLTHERNVSEFQSIGTEDGRLQGDAL